MALKPNTKGAFLVETLLVLDSQSKELLKGTVRAGRKTFEIIYYENGKSVVRSLATYITGKMAGRKYYWHHRNGNPFDYRLENLELLPRATHSSVLANNCVVAVRNRQRTEARSLAGETSIGVSRMRNKYYARLSVPGTGKVIQAGGFERAEDAARAYDAARIEHGLAAVNFPVKADDEEAVLV